MLKHGSCTSKALALALKQSYLIASNNKQQIELENNFNNSSSESEVSFVKNLK